MKHSLERRLSALETMAGKSEKIYVRVKSEEQLAAMISAGTVPPNTIGIIRTFVDPAPQP